MRFLSILYLLLSVFSSFTEAVDETNGLPNMMEKPANEAHTEKLYWEMMKPADSHSPHFPLSAQKLLKS